MSALNDYDFPNLKPADAESAGIQLRLQAAEEVLGFLDAQYGDPDEYLLFEDRVGYLDSDMAIHAFHIRYDHDAGTIRLRTAAQPTIALGMAWMVEHGASVSYFVQHGEDQSTPADAKSAAIARRIMASPGRYDIVDHGVELSESWALLRDSDPRAADKPYLLHIEHIRDEGGFTLREGSFASPQEAQAWLEVRDRSLPAALAADTVVQVSAAASAARSRSTSVPTVRATSGVLPEPVRVSAVPAAGGPHR
ncbi:hypothetical protein P3T36_003363 [Kitasatospora sp. MAP12-15]|uniref:hypothetical protein n=1 Tax=unclassified Kitasatospora TaxID=2633591 RepID=UPI0024760EC4|nr:hypothetical protein [Kitasatospora sp. MAP12-44]MDH6111341.1 hypothetical protein [Kitasatospora sp. MAP12-44]